MPKINPQGSKVNVIVKLYEKCFHKAYKQWLVARREQGEKNH
jgi:hypothetical protein